MHGVPGGVREQPLRMRSVCLGAFKPREQANCGGKRQITVVRSELHVGGGGRWEGDGFEETWVTGEMRRGEMEV